MKLGPVVGFAIVLALSGGAARAADWNGTYVYSQTLGAAAGGVVPVVEHRLTVAPGSCTIVAEGYQTNENIRCKATPQGDKLDVSFVSYADGKVENKYGVRVYKIDQPLFSIAPGAQGLTTTWQGYNTNQPAGAAPTGVFFKKKSS